MIADQDHLALSHDFYFDSVFCISPNCRCAKRLTPEIVNEAKILWATYDIPGGPPVALMYRCGKPEDAPHINVALPEWVEALFNAPISPPPLPPRLLR